MSDNWCLKKRTRLVKELVKKNFILQLQKAPAHVSKKAKVSHTETEERRALKLEERDQFSDFIIFQELEINDITENHNKLLAEWYEAQWTSHNRAMYQLTERESRKRAKYSDSFYIEWADLQRVEHFDRPKPPVAPAGQMAHQIPWSTEGSK